MILHEIRNREAYGLIEEEKHMQGLIEEVMVNSIRYRRSETYGLREEKHKEDEKHKKKRSI